MINHADRIWKTRKIRINTETRLNINAWIIDIIIPLYSLNLIVITILPLNKNDIWISFISIVGSLVILIGSLITSNRNFKLRAFKMRLHYIKLDKLYTRINSCTDAEKEKIYEEYLDELKTIENHSDFDYRKTLIKQKKDPDSKFPKPTNVEALIYYMFLIMRWILIISIFTIPVIIDFLIVF